MTQEEMTQDNRTNLDKLNYFYENKLPVHILLTRINDHGKHIFLNGLIEQKLTDTLFLIDEVKLGMLRVSIFEIKDNGVSEYIIGGIK